MEAPKLEKILNITSIGEKENFIKLYFNDLGKLWDLSKPTLKLFGEIISLVEYNPQATMHNLISLNSSKKNLIAEKLKWEKKSSYSQFSHSFKELCKAQILQRLANDTYLLNPFIASKANWADVRLLRSIRMEITYNESHKTLITYIESKDDFTKSTYKDKIESSVVPSFEIKREEEVQAEIIQEDFSILGEY